MAETQKETQPENNMKVIMKEVRHFSEITAVYILSERDGIYSLSVTTLTPEGDLDDRVFVPDLCPGIEEAKRLFSSLAEGDVTPCTVIDILEDMVCI